ncbi:alpha/beta hydrolase fold domain-containing protein [Actinomadura sp. NTSP31]|uniref:alpha/beta hydrolase fold domain-containing protein n=1 Tax=Actinomadura sp. NTSP31 TaxID=1735447 RepID=UPI0035BF21C4
MKGTTVEMTVENISVDGKHGAVPVRVYARQAGGTPLLWVHGGAFCGGSIDMAESHAVACAIARAGRTVVTVDYRRVPPCNWLRRPKPGSLPGVRFPVPLDDVSDAFLWVRKQSPTGDAVMGGASAGACLAAAATLRFRDHGAPLPSRLALAYGTFHPRLPSRSAQLASRLRGRHGIVQFRPSTVERMNRNYAGSPEAMTNPYAFPGGAGLEGFPPALLLDADRDSLRASGEAFAAELAAARVPVVHRVVAESAHGFLDKPSRRHFATGIGILVGWLSDFP